MSRWFTTHRQEFIRDQLKTFGQIRRDDICKKFQVSTPQASADIRLFIEEHPNALYYDGKAKMYVLDQEVLNDH